MRLASTLAVSTSLVGLAFGARARKLCTRTARSTPAKSEVNMVLGTMLFGGQVDERVAEEMVETMVAYAAPEKAVLDTARMYQKGLTEQVLGRILARRPDIRARVLVHTKADPSIQPLTPTGLAKQLNESLNALGMDCVDVLYLHSPDTSVPIEDTMGAMASFVTRGMVREIGLSNYPSWMVVAIHALCKERGWPVPTIYQGVYHLLTRSMEYELIPALRYLGMRLYIFSPLCGGLLTGRYTSMDQIPQLTSGRFSKEFDKSPMYVERYVKPEIFEAVNMLNQCAKENGITLTELALRWLKYHSKLIRGDGVVFGSSNLKQYSESLAYARNGPLPESALQVIARAADISRPVEAQYYRGYDKQHGRADRWLQQFS
jgi:aflatoxin B1 aldehyde reductase